MTWSCACFSCHIMHLQLGGPSRGSISKLFRDNHIGCSLQDDVEVAEVQLLLALLAAVIGRFLLNLPGGSHQATKSGSELTSLRPMSWAPGARHRWLRHRGGLLESAPKPKTPRWGGAPFTNFSSGETFCSLPPETRSLRNESFQKSNARPSKSTSGTLQARRPASCSWLLRS